MQNSILATWITGDKYECATRRRLKCGRRIVLQLLFIDYESQSIKILWQTYFQHFILSIPSLYLYEQDREPSLEHLKSFSACVKDMCRYFQTKDPCDLKSDCLICSWIFLASADPLLCIKWDFLEHREHDKMATPKAPKQTNIMRMTRSASPARTWNDPFDQDITKWSCGWLDVCCCYSIDLICICDQLW
jgi:hypothetical protein